MMKTLKIYQIDVFTDEPFKGNPAAVCILEEEISENHMKLIAAEMNLSETAFVLPMNEESDTYSLRWFTPEVEVPLCGHGTIGTAKVLFDIFKIESEEIIFKTKSGRLTAQRYEDGIGIDMALDEYEDINITDDLLAAIGIDKYIDAKVGKTTRKVIIRVDNEEQILDLNPDFSQMKSLEFTEDIKGVAITTNNTNKYDFLSRYFNPWAGINEDPVTGSVHTVLAKYWADILNKNEFIAYQASNRGGKLNLKIKDEERLEVIGEALVVLKGDIYL
ncbi:MAG: PhzF family phenazine biosynthesis protein [Tissierella sp.]|nr:PhzF family phenazine biosynthesis protein [Tissierella sp.]